MSSVKMLNTFLNLIYPRVCACCHTPLDPCGASGHLCPGCRRSLQPHPGPCCGACGRLQPSLSYSQTRHDRYCRCAKDAVPSPIDLVWAAYPYDRIIQQLLHLAKFGDHYGVLGTLGHLMREFAERHRVMEPVDCVTYVPLHPTRQRQREYNQSRVLADILGRAFNRPVVNLLRRAAYQQPQSRLSRHARLEQIQEAFLPQPNASPAGQTILLIDDVMTTGATLRACSHALRQHGAARIVGFVLAHDV